MSFIQCFTASKIRTADFQTLAIVSLVAIKRYIASWRSKWNNASVGLKRRPPPPKGFGWYQNAVMYGGACRPGSKIDSLSDRTTSCMSSLGAYFSFQDNMAYLCPTELPFSRYHSGIMSGHPLHISPYGARRAAVLEKLGAWPCISLWIHTCQLIREPQHLFLRFSPGYSSGWGKSLWVYQRLLSKITTWSIKTYSILTHIYWPFVGQYFSGQLPQIVISLIIVPSEDSLGHLYVYVSASRLLHHLGEESRLRSACAVAPLWSFPWSGCPLVVC